MNKFMLVFHSPFSQETEFQAMSPEQLQTVLEKWNTWIGGISAQDKMEGTNALLPTGKVIRQGGQVITDGPYTEGKEIIGGYLMLSARDLDEAILLSQGCPHLETPGASVEVRPIQIF